MVSTAQKSPFPNQEGTSPLSPFEGGQGGCAFEGEQALRTKRHVVAPLLLIFIVGCFAARAVELWSNEEASRFLTLNPTLKISGLGSHNPGDRILFPSAWNGLGLFRLRFDLNAQVGDDTNALIAYEHSARWASRDNSTTAGSGILPSAIDAPYRLTQLYDTLFDENRVAYYHELDRALLAYHPDWGEVVLGRQAIGLGRGVLFSAVDMFAPFSPLEVDREWRRGVDAARVEYRLSDTSSMEGIGVFGESWEDSALLIRLRGYVGQYDAEILGGKRGEDVFIAGVVSSSLGDAEVHGEVALFYVPDEHPHGEPFGIDRLVPKLVLGTSYTFDVGNGLSVFGEYHYSGFGAKDLDDIASLYVDPDFVKRSLRGDSQILGRHALGVQVAYPFNESLSGAWNIVMSPKDGSGVLSSSLRWDLSRTTSLSVTGFIPWGASPHHGRLGSEYGTSGESVFVQVSMYF